MFGKFFRFYSELLSKFGTTFFQEYASKLITNPVFNSDIIYKLMKAPVQLNDYDQVIIERAIDFVRGHSTTLYKPFLTVSHQAVGVD